MCVISRFRVVSPLIRRHSSTSNHLSVNQYNWLGTVFYLSYLVFEYPQNLALQRWPVGKWMRSVEISVGLFKADRWPSINIFIWGIALLCHAACKSFGGLFAVRFILGMCEGAITPGFMIVCTIRYPVLPPLKWLVSGDRYVLHTYRADEENWILVYVYRFSLRISSDAH